MQGGLLVAHEDVLHGLLLEDRIIYMKGGAARITEYVLHTLVMKGADEHLATGQEFGVRGGGCVGGGLFWAHG